MQPDPNQPTIAIGALDSEISDEEANEEIDIPTVRPVSAPRASVAPAAKPTDPDDITPSVRKAVDKAAEILRELRDTD